jgi:hypothetical protein
MLSTANVKTRIYKFASGFNNEDGGSKSLRNIGTGKDEEDTNRGLSKIISYHFSRGT